MTIQIRASRVLLSSLCAAMLVSAGVMVAPSASSANCPGGTVLDPRTGVCWSQVNPSNSFGGSGNIPCLPGRLGLCLSALQNTPIPGAQLRPQPPAGPAPRVGPQGTWP